MFFSTEKASENHGSLKIVCLSLIKQKTNEKAKEKLLFFTCSFFHLTAKDPESLPYVPTLPPTLCQHLKQTCKRDPATNAGKFGNRIDRERN